MFDAGNLQWNWPRLHIGGPRAGEYQTLHFTSVPTLGYQSATWFSADGSVLSEINQHESIQTIEDFGRAVEQWTNARAS